MAHCELPAFLTDEGKLADILTSKTVAELHLLAYGDPRRPVQIGTLRSQMRGLPEGRERLLAVAICRNYFQGHLREHHLEVLAFAERMTTEGGFLSGEEIEGVRHAAWDRAHYDGNGFSLNRKNFTSWYVAATVSDHPLDLYARWPLVGHKVREANRCVAGHVLKKPPHAYGNKDGECVREAPWLDDLVIGMAVRCELEQDFSYLPIIADRLEERECPVADLMDHLRSGKHWKGCWATAYILGGTAMEVVF